MEGLDVSTQAWKDLYGRTGIKKGYNELFFEKNANETYAKLAAITTEAEFDIMKQQFQSLIDRAQKEAKHSFEDTYYASADVALLSDAFVDNAAELLLKRLKEPIREIKETFNPLALLKNQPVLLIPSGALMGYADSTILKSSLDEYVKAGGTLIVLSQKHGYDYASVPTPDGTPITGYGWEEDQNCFTNAVSIETWHQMFSGQSRATPTVNVDGYFTSFPANSTILLRRTANGQPALLMYEHGQGRVIVTSMYADWAYGHGQASQEEIAMVRDILSWAKAPTQLLEVKPGQSIFVPVTVRNTTSIDAATVKLQLYTPDRSTLLSEQVATLAVPAGQSATTTAGYHIPADSVLGIHHIDYILLDAAGNIIQPQAETDSGRFAVSNPPQIGTKSRDIWLSITSQNQEVFFNEPFAYTFHIYNNSTTTRNLTLKSLLPHTGRTHEWIVTATPNGETTINGSDLFIDRRWMFETLRAYLYDESGKEIANYMLSFKGLYPAVTVTTAPGKGVYTRGETVNLSVSLKNTRSAATTVKLNVTVTDPANSAVFAHTHDVSLAASGTSAQPLSFTLPAAAMGGVYTISTEVLDGSSTKIGGDSASFEIPLRFVTITPSLPAAWNPGGNTVSFNLTNIGFLSVSAGALDVTLKDPAGAAVATVSHPFTLNGGESKAIDMTIAVPPLTFGTYTLSYTQSNESNTGKGVTVTLPGTPVITAAFDKPSYRVRESATMALTLANAGKFNLSGLTVTVAVPDANYTHTETVTLAANQSTVLNRVIPIPETIAAGPHTVTVTLTLPGGSTISKNLIITVPRSSLQMSLNQNAFAAGSVVSPVIANSGGQDTQAQYRLTLYDAKAAIMADKSGTETVRANGSVSPAIDIPAGAADGGYEIVASYTDLKTGGVAFFRKALVITGMKAALSVRTDRQSYLPADGITALSSIVNSGMELLGGNLHLQLTTAGGSLVQKTWTSQYDFQQGTRSGVDTYETPDNVTLLSYTDNFNDGIIDGDRWSTWGVPGYPPTEQNGTLRHYIPTNPSFKRVTSEAYSNVAISGDFDAQVDYNVISPWNYSGNNHAARLQVFLSNWWMYIDLWGSGSLQFGTIDAWGSYTNVSTNRLQGKLRIRRVGSTYYTYYWNGSGWTSLLTYGGRPAGPANLDVLIVCWGGNVETLFDNYTVTTHTYNSSGTMNLTYDAGRSDTWGNLSFNADMPTGTSIRFRTRTADTQAGLTSAAWSSYITTSGSPITSSKSRWIEIETTLSTTNTAVTPTLRDITVTQGRNPGDILWQTDVPVDMAQGAVFNLSNTIAPLGAAGKYYLQGTFSSTTGQSIATSESPFYVVQGSTTMSLNPDKKAYKPGETITITGEVKNLAPVEAANLMLAIKGKPAGGTEKPLYSDAFTIPAGGSRPFTVSTTAETEGIVVLTGTVTQNTATLAEISDQYVVAAPQVTTSVAAPDVAGNDPFTVSLTLTNSGKTDATVTVASPFAPLPETVTVPAGEARVLQYARQITADTPYTVTFTGDLNRTVSGTVKYGLAGTVVLAPQALYPEGRVAVPMTVTNTGLLEKQYDVACQLTGSAATVSQETRNYYLATGNTASDTLTFDLTEGSYQLAAAGQLPAMAATAGFSVRKEVKADLALTVGAQTGAILPATVAVINLGYNPIAGAVRLSLVDGNSVAVWSSNQDVSLPQALAPASQSLAFSSNLASLKPGNYTIKAELLDAANRQLAQQSSPFTVLGAVFDLTQLPPYQTIPSGGSATMTFKVKNNGNQEGSVDLSFKADDLTDATRTEWLKPGEEKEIAFGFQAAADLDEKDYTATYRLKSGGATIKEGVVAYHLAGIKLAVTAALDEQNYNVGDTANLTLTITQQDAGASPNLFAQVNYNGFNEKRDFTLAGSQTLTFSVPLAQITGEKLFYGIYTDTGRSIHLNTIYIYKADGALTVTTDKQVYNPGETVTVAISGAATGDLTLTGPGDFTNTLAFSGSATRSFVLPSPMIAGTYYLNAQLKTQNSELITIVHPIDVAGIQVKVKEALLDKTKYVATDTMNLALTIESNQDLSATVKTWVVDPTGNYTEAGNGAVGLTNSAPVLSTLNSQLSTASLGIHKLVYGIYQGDLLLASGAKAFDIGEAVLLGLSTDKTDYPDITLPVTVKADLYGTTSAGIEFFLDGTSIKTDSATLAGFSAYTLVIPADSLTPGLHVLKGVLTSGGLTSTKETRFTYGSNLSDLTAQVANGGMTGGSLKLAITVINQGKTSSTATTVALHDGNPAEGGTVIATLNVPPLDPGAPASLAYTWNVLGKAGDHAVYVVVDPANLVTEFNEANNTSLTHVSLPNLSLNVSTGGASFPANTAVGIATDLANLSSSAIYQDLALKIAITDPQGNETLLNNGVITSLGPASATADVVNWNTASKAPGNYTVNARLTGGGATLAANSASFMVEPTPSITGTITESKDEVIQGFPLAIGYGLTNNGNIDLPDGDATVELIDKTTDAKTASFTQPFDALSVLQKLDNTFEIAKTDVPPGDYTLRLVAATAGATFLLGEKTLKVLPPLEVTNSLSMLPRVLVLLNKEEIGSASTQTLATQTLNGMGAYYRIASDLKSFKEELRSGFYNISLLVGNAPLTDHLDEELAARVNSGDGLILLDYKPMNDSKFREVSGIRSDGSLNEQTHQLTLYDSPVTVAGTYGTVGKAQRVTVEASMAVIAGAINEKGKGYPALVLNPYGVGKTVTFAFVPDASLLQNAIAYAAPARVEAITATPLPVEIGLKSFGAGFNLRVSGTSDAALPILMTWPTGNIQDNSATWELSLMKDEAKKLIVLHRLPAESGLFDLTATVYYLKAGSYEPYNGYHFPVSVERGVVTLKSEIANELKNLPVTGQDIGKLRKILDEYQQILNRPLSYRDDLEKGIKELLGLIEEVRELSADTAAIRLDLSRLLRVFERQWLELPSGG